MEEVDDVNGLEFNASLSHFSLPNELLYYGNSFAKVVWWAKLCLKKTCTKIKSPKWTSGTDNSGRSNDTSMEKLHIELLIEANLFKETQSWSNSAGHSSSLERRNE